MKNFIEQRQIYIYLLSLVFAALLGLYIPNFTKSFEPAISILLTLLMFFMFSQIPFFKFKGRLISFKFIIALIFSNFILIPIFVFCLISVFHITHTGILIGLYLVLLAPCIDYVIVFTALGKGNAQYMLMSTPILLILQIIFLPIYLTIFLNHITIPSITLQPFLHTFIAYILIPLILALILQWTSIKSTKAQKCLHITNWFPEIIMALVLFVIVSSQIQKITSHLTIIYMIIPIYIIYLLIAPLLGYLSGKLFNLEINTNRTLAFSSGTRNALVVLPITFALPNNISNVATIVVVTQTLVELLGEIIYIKFIPKLIRR
ncbi:arsenic resistance protein [Staphylococcus gallinarum]|uniref:arsenic resistance protein n=1 Tax=Staphylococcus gallinarum TaxID=1293 RepID=UPI001E6261A2|nr:arsenic resistance protein [Staphylococcus gallinarum]MCD8843541.1 arsenic resistance protein [Staphylococcus gallinarum]MEB7037628.1 arsenic resistance protein [Staphylococcus gallinarum]